ncbi:hypothetical protein D9757_000966 [Collybiopsis confluens]|uniref:Uncharacterized protein n=1 Tax=Collybiopsis confluens TaxID=2823264 RepID=A0A8H5I0E0_9AGAR|nr:hypothetical protein D9757_000966 [Collybiopsis confluens]
MQKRGPKTGSKRQPASDVENLVYKMLAAPEDALVIRDILVELAKYARSLEDQLDRLKPPVILSSSPERYQLTEGAVEEDSNVFDALASRLTSQLGFGKFQKRYGAFITQKLLQTALVG